MTYPNVNPDFETFFEPTRIWLFGKPFPSLVYARNSMGPGPGNANEFVNYPDAGAADVGLLNQLPMPPRRIERALRRQYVDPAGNAHAPIFARIYSFSFEGHYYTLPRPLLFLVSNNGQSPQRVGFVNGYPAFDTKFVGIEAKDWQFSNDILGWAVDKRDLAVCLDMEVGPYQEILLDSTIAFEEEMASRGSAAWVATSCGGSE